MNPEELKLKIEAFHALAQVFQALAGIALVPVLIYAYKAYKLWTASKL